MLLIKPTDQTVEDSDTATFSCHVANSSFRIVWLVNGTDAYYDMFLERGVSIRHINETASQLKILGHIENNQTWVQCVSLRYHNHQITAVTISERAYMTVNGINLT